MHVEVNGSKTELNVACVLSEMTMRLYLHTNTLKVSTLEEEGKKSGFFQETKKYITL